MNLPDPGMFEDWQDWARSVMQELNKPTAYAPKESVGRVSVFKSVVGAGYLRCDGSSFSPDSYPALLQFLGVNVVPNLASPYGIGYVVGIKT